MKWFALMVTVLLLGCGASEKNRANCFNYCLSVNGSYVGSSQYHSTAPVYCTCRWVLESEM
jgi:hypothetical protein